VTRAKLASSYRIALALVAGLLVAALLLVLPPTGDAARPRYKCSKSYTRHISAVLLSASRVRPGCGGAALMASDINYDASRRFPRPLRTGYVAYRTWHEHRRRPPRPLSLHDFQQVHHPLRSSRAPHQGSLHERQGRQLPLRVSHGLGERYWRQ
jgi:hypothetical protein